MGFSYIPQVQSDITIANIGGRSLLKVQQAGFDSVGHSQLSEQGGEGVAELIEKGKDLLSKAGLVKKFAGKAIDALTGETGTRLRNLIPSSDEGARDAFPGEKHMVLKLKNGKNGKRGLADPGRSYETEDGRLGIRVELHDRKRL